MRPCLGERGWDLSVGLEIRDKLGRLTPSGIEFEKHVDAVVMFILRKWDSRRQVTRVSNRARR